MKLKMKILRIKQNRHSPLFCCDLVKSTVVQRVESTDTVVQFSTTHSFILFAACHDTLCTVVRTETGGTPVYKTYLPGFLNCYVYIHPA